MSNPSGHWVDKGNRKDFINEQIFSIYGRVSSVIREGRGVMYWWEARVALDARDNLDKPICGYAKTMERAQRIVEVLLWETDTVERPIA